MYAIALIFFLTGCAAMLTGEVVRHGKIADAAEIVCAIAFLLFAVALIVGLLGQPEQQIQAAIASRMN